MKTSKTLPPGFVRPMARSQSFPWDVLLDGNWHILVQDEDFVCPLESMKTNARANARSRGYSLDIAVSENLKELAIRAIPRKTSTQAPPSAVAKKTAASRRKKG